METMESDISRRISIPRNGPLNRGDEVISVAPGEGVWSHADGIQGEEHSVSIL